MKGLRGTLAVTVEATRSGRQSKKEVSGQDEAITAYVTANRTPSTQHTSHQLKPLRGPGGSESKNLLKTVRAGLRIL